MSREFNSNAVFVGGNTGEGIVQNILDYSTLKYYHDIYLKDSSGKVTQIDFLVITDSSLICIEVKNFNKCVIKGDDESVCWTACYRSGNRQFLNPIRQNKIHTKMCIEIFGDLPVYNIVAFSSSCGIRIEPTSEANTRVVNITDLWYELVDINNSKNKKFNKERKESIAYKIEEFISIQEVLYEEHQRSLARNRK